MATPIQVFNPVWLKATVILGLTFLGGVTAYSVWAIARDNSRSTGAKIGLAALGFFFAYLLLVGLKIARFLNHVFVVQEDIAIVRSGDQEYSYPWSDLHVRVSNAMQIIDVRDRTGRLILSIDFYATNSHYLRHHAANQGAGDRPPP